MNNFMYIHNLFNLLINSYFFDVRCVLIITDDFNDLEYYNKNIPVVYLKFENNTFSEALIFHHYGCQDFVIFHQNLSTIFKKLENTMLLHNERFNNRKYIIIEPNNTNENIMDLLKLEESKHVANIIFIKFKSIEKNNILTNSNIGYEEIYQLFTHEYVGEKYNKIIDLDLWFSKNNSFLYSNNLYPDKVTNQQGKPLQIGTFTYKPYSIIDEENQTYDGIEMILMLEYTKKYNLTPMFTVIGNDYWGEIYQNWTGIGLLGSLAEGKVEVGFAALYQWMEDYNYLDYSKPLIRTGVNCLIPAPGLAAGWLTPIYSFSMETWLYVGIIFILCICTLFLVVAYYNKSNIKFNLLHRKYISIWDMAVFQVIRIFLFQDITTLPNKYTIKFVVGVILLQALLITSFYISGFSSIMTIPRYENAIKTVKDLADSNLPWGAESDAWLISLKDTKEQVFKTLIENFVVHEETNLREHSLKHHFGFALERLQYGHFSVGSYVKGDIIEHYRLLEEDLYWEQCIYMTRKSSILLPSIDNIVLRAYEGGLIGFWESEVVQRQMDMTVQRGIAFNLHNENQNVPVKLKWVHVEGAFGILLLGYMVALIIFCAEYLTKKLTLQQ